LEGLVSNLGSGSGGGRWKPNNPNVPGMAQRTFWFGEIAQRGGRRHEIGAAAPRNSGLELGFANHVWSKVVFGSKVQKGKRVKILPFVKSGKSFAIRGVWIQMAKVLTKVHLNLFSSFCHRVFGSKWKKKEQIFCYFLLLSVFVVSFFHRVSGSKWKKKRANFLLFALLPKDPNRP
jgi:hypothetical protein